MLTLQSGLNKKQAECSECSACFLWLKGRLKRFQTAFCFDDVVF